METDLTNIHPCSFLQVGPHRVDNFDIVHFVSCNQRIDIENVLMETFKFNSLQRTLNAICLHQLSAILNDTLRNVVYTFTLRVKNYLRIQNYVKTIKLCRKNTD